MDKPEIKKNVEMAMDELEKAIVIELERKSAEEKKRKKRFEDFMAFRCGQKYEQ